MLARQALQWGRVRTLRPMYLLRRCSQHAAQDDIRIDEFLSSHAQKQPQREPYMKNVFMGKLDVEFLVFPEPQAADRYTDFFKWLQPIENYISECINDKSLKKEEILSQLKTLGVFRGMISEDYGGLALSESESAKLVETVSAIPWLGIYLVQNNIIPVRVISKYGTAAQKEKYLTRIASGELIPTMCVTESMSGVNLENFRSEIVLNIKGIWTLRGEKILVFNGADANLFVVVAHCTQGNTYDMKDLSVVLVEKDNTIICKDADEMVGQRDTSLCTVIFEGTEVPVENIPHETIDTSKNILKDIVSPGKQNMAAVAIGTLKHFIELVTTNVLSRKYFDKNMHEFDYVIEVIGKMTSSLYSMESVLYLTTAMADTFENQDIELEQAITETYCANECVRNINEGLHLIGAQCYFKKYPYMQMLENALFFSTFCTYNMDAHAYIALLGLQHTGKTVRDTIYKGRNPLLFPLHAFKSSFRLKSKVNLYIPDNLHPTLQHAGEALEQTIDGFKAAVLSILEVHGVEVTDRQMELNRLSIMATDIYVALAVLARASRAYCIGIKNSVEDRDISNVITAKASESMIKVANNMVNILNMNRDDTLRRIADHTYKKKGYVLEHPLARVN